MEALTSHLRRARRPVGVLFGFLRQTAENYADDKAAMMSAAISFYTVLSLSPLLVLLVVFAGLAYGEQQARASITTWLYQQLGHDTAQTVVGLLERASAPGATTVPGLVSLALMLWGASRLFSNLQLALNHIWNVRPKDLSIQATIIQIVRKRILTFLLLLLLGSLFVVSLALDALLPLAQRVFVLMPGSVYWYRLASFGASSVIVGVGVALVYMILPDVRLQWRFVWKGAFLTGLLLVAGKLLLGWYLGRQSVSSAYGAAGSVVALLLWANFSAQVFFFGAEITKLYARKRGGTCEPEPHAEVAEPQKEQSSPSEPLEVADREPAHG